MSDDTTTRGHRDTPVTHSASFLSRHIASLLKSEQASRLDFESFKERHKERLQSLSSALEEEEDAMEEKMRRYRKELDVERAAKLNEAKERARMIGLPAESSTTQRRDRVEEKEKVDVKDDEPVRRAARGKEKEGRKEGASSRDREAGIERETRKQKVADKERESERKRPERVSIDRSRRSSSLSPFDYFSTSPLPQHRRTQRNDRSRSPLSPQYRSDHRTKRYTLHETSRRERRDSRVHESRERRRSHSRDDILNKRNSRRRERSTDRSNDFTLESNLSILEKRKRP